VRIRFDFDEEPSQEDLQREAQTTSDALYKHKRENARLRKLYLGGKLPRCSIPYEERERLRSEFFARGGLVSKVAPGVPTGALLSPFWSADRNALIKGVRENDLTSDENGFPRAVPDEDDL
jgi:hypothetical protein